MSFAIFDEGVDDGGALPWLGMPDEEPIFHSQLAGSHGSFGSVVVNGCIGREI